MPGPEECFESKQALNARFRESNRNISPIEKDYHTNLKECKNDILFIAYVYSAFFFPDCKQPFQQMPSQISTPHHYFQTPAFRVRIYLSYLLFHFCRLTHRAHQNFLFCARFLLPLLCLHQDMYNSDRLKNYINKFNIFQIEC